jgi:hypothetical protein
MKKNNGRHYKNFKRAKRREELDKTTNELEQGRMFTNSIDQIIENT